MANIIDTLAVAFEVDPSKMEEGLQKVAEGLNRFEQNLRKLETPIEQIAEKFNASGLLMGHVSDEVASKIMESGTKAQKAALLAGKGIDELDRKARALVGGFKKVGASILNAFKPSNLIENFGKQLANLGAPVAALLGVGSLFNNFTKNGEKLLTLSDRINVSVNALDAWGKANIEAGGSAEAFQSALDAWTSKAGQSAESFFTLGKRIQGLSRAQAEHYLTTMGVSKEASRVFVKYRDSAQSAAEAMKAVSMTREQAENAAKFNELWRKLTYTIQTFANQILTFVVPVLNVFVKTLTNAFEFISKHATFFKILIGSLSALLGGRYLLSILGTIKAMGGFVTAIKAAVAGTKAFSAALLANPLGMVVAAVVALSLALDDLYAFTTKGQSAFEKFLKWVGVSDETIESIRDTLKSFCDWVTAIPDRISEAFKGVGKTFKSLWNLIFGDGTTEEFKGDVENLFDNAFLGIPSKIKGYISEPLNQMIAFVKSKLESLKGLFTNWWGNAKSLFGFGDDEEAQERNAVPADASQQIAATVANTSNRSEVVNNVNTTVENHITTADNPDAIATAVGASVDSAGGRTNRALLGNIGSGVMQK